ncbi:glycoside hydrolase family 2 protein [Bifidobacterium aquikefiri]|uniref:glycoside hydrolase family 2 protein n=1 Tax=Bifidobacterium aquikefiri TaxID=1653207 RepID=UPI0039EC46D0
MNTEQTYPAIDIPRPEHPNPQWQRSTWMNLNGSWDFDFDMSASGIDQRWFDQHDYSTTITVPFCPESELSGIGFTDFIPCCWYRRTVLLTEAELTGRVLLHFGAVDYLAHVYVNGVEAGSHKGGYASFSLDITHSVHTGENVIVVCATDDTRGQQQPTGKQCDQFSSYSCLYTRTTGIWQTVWLEFVPETYIEQARYHTNIHNATITIEATLHGTATLHVAASFKGALCGSVSVASDGGTCTLTLPLSQTHLWEPGIGNLYDITLSYGDDHVKSYVGLREIRLDGYRFLINGKSVFQRLVLDQGFYPRGIYTAPTAADLEQDIMLSKQAGFNGARLHERAFEPLYLYYCDLHGYLAWGEMASWGFDISKESSFDIFIPEWLQILQRDVNHPAIIGWCPFNETWDFNGRRQNDDVLRLAYQVTKAYDPERPCIDTSGHYHVVTDIYDLHDYEQDIDNFSQRYDDWGAGNAPIPELYPDRQHCEGIMPFFISEYGGIKWDPSHAEESSAWGYGQQANSEDEFISRYRGLTNTLLSNPRMFGFCFTQLYDVEQECNGIYNYDRMPKVDIAAIRSINAAKAAIERSVESGVCDTAESEA